MTKGITINECMNCKLPLIITVLSIACVVAIAGEDVSMSESECVRLRVTVTIAVDPS